MKSLPKKTASNSFVYSIIRANNGIDEAGMKMGRGNKRKVVVIVGPTAVGKSALAVLLGRKYNGEVISADSRQIYKGLDIGTGKITGSEMKGVPHHLLDVADPKKQFSVSDYQKLAKKKLEEVWSKNRLPIIAGGTGLYIQAIVNDVVFPNVPPNKELREKLRRKAVPQLFSILRKLDVTRAQTIDRSNPRRLIRAIEVASTLGRVPPYQNAPRKDIDVLFIGLTLPPDDLKKRISIRLFARMNECMIEEVKKLHDKGLSWKRMEELGLEYRYISRYIRGLLTKEEMTLKLQSEIWRYAKRQMTWFKRDRRIKWFSLTEKQVVSKLVQEFISA